MSVLLDSKIDRSDGLIPFPWPRKESSDFSIILVKFSSLFRTNYTDFITLKFPRNKRSRTESRPVESRSWSCQTSRDLDWRCTQWRLFPQSPTYTVVIRPNLSMITPVLLFLSPKVLRSYQKDIYTLIKKWGIVINVSLSRPKLDPFAN